MIFLGIGKNIILIGFFISIIGFVIYVFGDKFNFLGNLPGDFKYESKNIKVFIPITSMLIISAIFSFIINFIIKIFR